MRKFENEDKRDSPQQNGVVCLISYCLVLSSHVLFSLCLFLAVLSCTVSYHLLLSCTALCLCFVVLCVVLRIQTRQTYHKNICVVCLLLSFLVWSSHVLFSLQFIFHLNCCFLSCVILSCLLSSCFVLCCLVLSCVVLFCVVMCCVALCYDVLLSCVLVLSILVEPCLVWSCLVLCCRV